MLSCKYKQKAAHSTRAVLAVLTVLATSWTGADRSGVSAAFANRVVEPSKVMKQHRAWGYIDTSGAAAIKPQFDWGFKFHNGVAKVTVKVTDPQNGSVSDQTHYVDKHGNLLEPKKNPSVLIPKQVGNKFGYANDQGQLVLPAIWDFADEFSENRAVVGTGNRFKDPHFEIIDSQGNLIADLGSKQPFNSYKNGYLQFSDAHKEGYIDLSGKIVIKPKFELVGNFSEGLATARVTSGGKAGLIDTSGNWVVEPKYKWLGEFSEGLAFFDTGDDRGFIDKTGREVFKLPAKSSAVGSFHEGLASVCVGGTPGNFDIPVVAWSGSKLGFIDKTGKFVIQPRYEPCLFGSNFNDGLAPVTVGVGDAKKLGYIDKSGRFLIQPRFLEGFDFSEGLAPVCFDREIESRAKSNVFDSKEPTESEYITGITTAIRDSVHKVAPSTVVRCVVGIDARGRLDSVRLKSGPDGLALDKRVLDCIVNTKLPAKPDYLSNWQKRDFPILIRNGSVTEEGSASDPAKAKFARCEEIRAEIEKTHRLDDLIVREKLLQELVGIRHQLFNLADYELSTSLSELLNVAARLKHWSIAENAIKTLSQLELTGDLSFTTPHTGRQPLKAQSSQLSLAGLRLMQGRKDEALTLLLKASNNGDTTIKCAIYDQIGDIYFAKKDFKHAEQYYIQTCNTPEINSKNLPSLSTADPKIINSVNEQHKEKALYKLGMFYVAIDNLVKAKPCMDSFLRQLNTQDGKTTLATPNGFDWFEAYIALLNKERHFGEAEEFSKARALICAYDRTYIDRTGKQVGHMFFSSAEQFKDGLARVERFDRTGYINTAGEFAIKPDFILGRDMAEELAAVIPAKSTFPENIKPFFYNPMQQSSSEIEAPNKWGFINRSGKIVIPDNYVEAESFSGGLAAVRLNNGYDSWCYIDKSGKQKSKTGFTWASPFEGEFASVRVGAAPGTRGCIVDIYGGSLKRIDKSGRLLPDKPEPSALPSQVGKGEALGLQPFSIEVDGEKKWGYVDANGAVAIKPQFDAAYWFSGDRARVKIKNHMVAISKEGLNVVNPDCDELAPFVGDYAIFKKDRKCGLVDKNGTVIVQPIYDTLDNFTEGLALAFKDNIGGFIDTKGATAVPFKFKSLRPFSEGLAPALEGKRWGYIDKSGSWIIEPRFERAEPFHDGRAVVQYPEDLVPGGTRKHPYSRTIF